MPNQDADPLYVSLAAGEVYFDRFDAAGLPQGEMFLGTIDGYSLGVEAADTARIYSSVDTTRALLAEVDLRMSGKGTMKFRQYNRRNLELAWRGTEGALNNGSGTLTAVVIASVKKDRWFPVKQTGIVRRNITVTTVTGPGGTPTYVLNTDYKVDAGTGRIYITPASAIADASNIEVNGSYAADVHKYVAVGDMTVITGFMRFIANPHVGPKYEVQIWKAVLRPSALVELIQQSDFGGYDMDFECLADTTQATAERFFRTIER